MTLVEKACRVMVAAHSQQVRKTDGSPYVVHTAVVGLKLSQAGFSEAVVAAGLVHDVLDDASITREQLAAELGDEVATIVAEVSEGASDAATWKERKERYAEAISSGSTEAKAVSVADKIHNLESILEGHSQQGPALWQKFNAGRDQQLWFMDTMLEAYRSNWQHALVDQYAALLDKVRQLA